METNIITGDALTELRKLESDSVHCIVTSPPYYGLRDYGTPGQIGLEKTAEEYIAKLVFVFREARRVLRDDGTLWINLGDSYGPGKRLGGIPWRVAFALQSDEWILRQDIVWYKPNPMPESVRDRCTKAHEYLFLLTKLPRYYFDSEAIKEPAKDWGTRDRSNGKYHNPGSGLTPHRGLTKSYPHRNKRSVWTVAVRPYKGAHFATYPPDLIRPCILAGSPVGGTVLDMFAGSGTTGQVARELNRNSILIECNPDYVELIHARLKVAPHATN